MARYTGPKTKLQENLANRFSEKTNHLKRKIILQANTAIIRRRGKKSEYAIQLMEKQKDKIHLWYFRTPVQKFI